MTQQQRQERLLRALSHLLDAFEYSQDAQRGPWDFAVEIDQLRTQGLENSDLRWLSCRGFVEHRIETTSSADDERSFQPAGRFGCETRSCFVLTAEGVQAARSLLRRQQDTATVAAKEGGPLLPLDGLGLNIIAPGPLNGYPVWDSERRELRLDGQLVKQFRRPAANQEMILATFQEEGWPQCISDPIPQHPDIDSKRRLNDAIKSLNRHQQSPLIHFRGDGTAQGVFWERVHGNGHAADPFKR